MTTLITKSTLKFIVSGTKTDTELVLNDSYAYYKVKHIEDTIEMNGFHIFWHGNKNLMEVFFSFTVVGPFRRNQIDKKWSR